MTPTFVTGAALLALPFSFFFWIFSVGRVARRLAERGAPVSRGVRIYLAAACLLLTGSWIAAAVVFARIRWPLWWSLPLLAHGLHAAAVARLLQRRESSPNREKTMRS